jgi:hypothetical protein
MENNAVTVTAITVIQFTGFRHSRSVIEVTVTALFLG